VAVVNAADECATRVETEDAAIVRVQRLRTRD
jgi:hypothetical protein